MKYLLLILFFVISPVNYALSLKPNAPSRYVVQQGDSLWTIACRYLEHPWEWQALWRANPSINNPNRLYVGDILLLNSALSSPYIKVLSNGIVKLSPSTRIGAYTDPIPALPLTEIKPFLNESLVLDENVLLRAPYVVAYVGEHMLGGQGDEAYVKGLHPSKELPDSGTLAYSIFRAKKSYINPITKQFLGYQATLVGQAELVAGGEPSTILLTSINQGIEKNDRVLINNSPQFELYFHPKTPKKPVEGFILDMPNNMPSGNTQEAFTGVVVLSLGAANGVQAGDVVAIYGKLRIVKDPNNDLMAIQLPPERLGEAMIFRTFSKTSFALIVRSIRAVHILDTVSNP